MPLHLAHCTGGKWNDGIKNGHQPLQHASASSPVAGITCYSIAAHRRPKHQPSTALACMLSLVIVQVAAAGAVCNLLLSFSSIRSALIQADVLQTLAPLTQSMLPDLRLHAVWAFKNLANDCEDKVQSQLLSELSWSTFTALLVGDDDPRVREQAVALLQNLCKGGHSIQQASRR